MKIVETIEALREARAGMVGRIGLVPTMGALHAGHIALVKQAREDNDFVFVSIFVNPTQFGQHDDLSKYPRDLVGDLKMLEAAGVDLVFTPTPALMYPPGFQTWVEVTEVTSGLEGERRPGHFRGVATVVAKLFNLTQPTAAYFGQKDAQQVAVIKRMARDLNFPLQIVVCPTVREADGLAMSSRNVYLSPDQRRAASVLYQALMATSATYSSGERRPDHLRATVEGKIKDVPEVVIDYVSVVDAVTLREVDEPGEQPLLVSLVIKMGSTRLLDNVLLPFELNDREGLTRVLGGA